MGPHYVYAWINGLFVLAWLWRNSAWGCVSPTVPVWLWRAGEGWMEGGSGDSFGKTWELGENLVELGMRSWKQECVILDLREKGVDELQKKGCKERREGTHGNYAIWHRSIIMTVFNAALLMIYSNVNSRFWKYLFAPSCTCQPCVECGINGKVMQRLEEEARAEQERRIWDAAVTAKVIHKKSSLQREDSKRSKKWWKWHWKPYYMWTDNILHELNYLEP